MKESEQIAIMSQSVRERVDAGAVPTHPSQDCPTAEQVWDAANLVASTRERRRVVDHTAHCPACAESWRLATVLNGRESESVAPVVSIQSRRRLAVPPAALDGWR